MKIVLRVIMILCLLGAALFLLWENRGMLSKQKVMDNSTYRPTLDSIHTIRKMLKTKNASAQVLEKEFISIMMNRIFPYWYGTKWDFYGQTQTPNEGNIACGYFVTTTLRDAGVPVNRVKMAQCASEEMIRNLTSRKHIHHFSNMSLRDFEKGLKKTGNGLYIVGLDNHTGFILISPGGNYFIHSSGLFPFQVVKDVLSESSILSRSAYRVVGKVSSDPAFLSKWVAN